MESDWNGLLANLAVVAGFVTLSTYLQDWIDGLTMWVRPLAFGVLMGAGAISAMLLPVHVAPGVNFDLRGSFIALSGFFGGPLPGLITAAAAASYRLHLGGAGAFAGCIGIGIATVVGTTAHMLMRGRVLRNGDIVVFSVVVALSVLVSLFALPPELLRSILGTLALPVVVLTFVATAMAGIALLHETRRRDMARANALLRSVFLTLPDCLNVKDLKGRFVEANPATARLMKVGAPEQLIGHTDFDFYPPDVAERFRTDEDLVLAAGQPTTIEQRITDAGVTSVWLSTLKAVLRDREGVPVGIITHNRDITDRKKLEQKLEQTRDRLAGALEHMADALVMFDKDQKLVFCNAQFLQMFPRIADLSVKGVPYRDLMRADVERGEQLLADTDLEAWLDELCASLAASGDRIFHLEGDRWLEARTRPTTNGASLVVLSDITDRKRAETALAALNRNLARLAATDGLTGLVNRRMFDQSLEREVARSRRDGAPLSLVLIDVDRFKAFNDTYGHPAGDQALLIVSACLTDGLKRPGDLVARYGGEEFAAILPNTSAEGAHKLAENIRRAIRARGLPHQGSDKGALTVSIGLATILPEDVGGRPEDLLRIADEALYAAKAAGRDCVRAGMLAEAHTDRQKLAG